MQIGWSVSKTYKAVNACYNDDKLRITTKQELRGYTWLPTRKFLAELLVAASKDAMTWRELAESLQKAMTEALQTQPEMRLDCCGEKEKEPCRE